MASLREKIGYALGDAAAGGITWKIMSIAFPLFFTKVFGLTFATTRAHFLRAALESIALQIKDLVDAMTRATGTPLREIAADGGPTKNQLLMQLQADLLQTPVVCTEVEDASALGAAIMGGLATGLWHTFDEVRPLRKVTQVIAPGPDSHQALYEGWLRAVRQLTMPQNDK